jgi:hypothetical protein
VTEHNRKGDAMKRKIGLALLGTALVIGAMFAGCAGTKGGGGTAAQKTYVKPGSTTRITRSSRAGTRARCSCMASPRAATSRPSPSSPRSPPRATGTTRSRRRCSADSRGGTPSHRPLGDGR